VSVYSHIALVRAHSPGRLSEWSLFRPCLRLEFKFHCHYCLSGESEVGPGQIFGGFEVDHFRPVSLFPQFARSYRNLLWSCHTCNRSKSNSWPTRADIKNGIRFPDPHKEPLGDHLELVGLLVHARNRSPLGQYTIDTLRLNSSVHQKIRKRRDVLNTFIRTCEGMIAELERSDSIPTTQLIEMRATLNMVRVELGGLAPWDAPRNCECSGNPAPLMSVPR
jgi:hypothetical protein